MKKKKNCVEINDKRLNGEGFLKKIHSQQCMAHLHTFQSLSRALQQQHGLKACPYFCSCAQFALIRIQERNKRAVFLENFSQVNL